MPPRSSWGPEIDLDNLPVGVYFELDLREIFDPNAHPSPPVLGDLHEDLEEVRQ
jgi:hypothetical protein